MSDAPTGATEVAGVQQNIVAALVQAELANRAVLINAVTDYSYLWRKGAASVSIPKRTSFTAAEKAENVDGEIQALTFSNDEITMVPYLVPSIVEDEARRRSVVDLDPVYLEGMVSAMVDKIEAAISAKIIKAANDIQLTGTSNLLPTRKDILAAKKYLEEANCPKEDRFLIVSPEQEAGILDIDGFVNADKYGSDDNVKNGEIGRIFGFKVLVSNQFASDTEIVAMHKSHCGYVMSQEFKFEKQRGTLASQSDELSLSSEFGAAQLDSGARGAYLDESAES